MAGIFTRKEPIRQELLDRNSPSCFAKIESTVAGKIRGALFVTRLRELRDSVKEWSNAGGLIVVGEKSEIYNGEKERCI